MNTIVVWIIRGSQRKALFVNLSEKPFLPNKLRKRLSKECELNLSLREMSRHLRDFEEKKLVRCVNEEDPYNRIYILTQKGKEIQKDIFKLDF